MPARIPVSAPSITEREVAEVAGVMASGWISSQAPTVEAFERALAARYGLPEAVSASNGTTALHLALLALGIGPGDEVLVPTLTFAASVNVIRHAGAEPRFVDVEPATWGIDPLELERRITPRSRAVIVVHLYGHPADVGRIQPIAARHGLRVIEDCAEAQDARVAGRHVGTFGDVGCFSFFANKIMTTGEGGACLTRDPALAASMRLLRSHGMDPARRYHHPVVGYNYRMTALQAALGLAQLARLDELVAARARVRAWYDRELSSLVARGDLTPMPHAPWADPVCWFYSVLVPTPRRDGLMAHLAAHGIETRPFFPPMHQQGAYPAHAAEVFARSEELAARGLNLPTFAGLAEADVARVSAHVREFFA